VGIVRDRGAAVPPSILPTIGQGTVTAQRLETGDELRPFIAHRLMDLALDGVVRPGARAERLARELHPRLAQSLATLAVVAGLARADEILPGVRAIARLRHDVIDRQVTALQSAILAGIPIADEDLATGQLHLRAGTLDQCGEADYRRDAVIVVYGVQDQAILFEDFGLTGEDHHQGALDVANVEGFVILIEDEHLGVQRRPPYWERDDRTVATFLAISQ